MAKRRYAITEEKIARFLKEGRGAGAGRAYKPFLTIHDLSSLGRSSRMYGLKTGRTHHFLSDLERAVALDFDWLEPVVDIREQFPLDRFETIGIAESIGVRHPWDRETAVDIVMTTDLLVDIVDRPGAARRQVAVSVKYARDLDSPRTLEKLEIERRYWGMRSVPWYLVTEREVSRERTLTLMWLNEWADLAPIAVPELGYWERRCDVLEAALFHQRDGTVRALFDRVERANGWQAGSALSAFRHLAAHRRVLIDVDHRFDVRRPLEDVLLPTVAMAA